MSPHFEHWPLTRFGSAGDSRPSAKLTKADDRRGREPCAEPKTYVLPPSQFSDGKIRSFLVMPVVFPEQQHDHPITLYL
jgi:hypothetical protein